MKQICFQKVFLSFLVFIMSCILFLPLPSEFPFEGDVHGLIRVSSFLCHMFFSLTLSLIPSSLSQNGMNSSPQVRFGIQINDKKIPSKSLTNYFPYTIVIQVF